MSRALVQSILSLFLVYLFFLSIPFSYLSLPIILCLSVYAFQFMPFSLCLSVSVCQFLPVSPCLSVNLKLFLVKKLAGVDGAKYSYQNNHIGWVARYEA